MPYTPKQHGLIGAALGAKEAGKSAPSYVPKSMSKLSTGKLEEMASSPTRKKVGRGDWGSMEKKSAGGSCTVVSASEMCKGTVPDVKITNHKGEVVGTKECKAGKTQKAMMVGA